MKPRSDSILKLRALKSPEFGEKVIEWLHEPAKRDESTGKAIPRTGGAWHAREQLAADGITVGESTLSDFYSWWQLRKTFQQADSLTNDFIELLKKEFPTAEPGKIQKIGQDYFTMQAMAKRDPEEFREMEFLRVAKDSQLTKQLELELKTKVFQVKSCELFLKWFEDKRAREIVTGTATHAEKIEALGQAMFGEDWKD